MARGGAEAEAAFTPSPHYKRRVPKPPRPVERVIELKVNSKGVLLHRSQDPERKVKIRRAIRAYAEAVVDFGGVERARSHDAEGVLHQLQQFAQERRHEDGATAILRNLSGPMAAQIGSLLGQFERAELVSREIDPDTGRATLTVKLPAWARDPVRAEFLQQLIDRDGPQCVWCSTELGVDDRRAELDHILTRMEGGVDHVDDLVLSCGNCNRNRGHFTASEWLKILASDSRRKNCVPNVEAVQAALARSAAFHRDAEAVAAVVPISVLAKQSRGLATGAAAA